MTHQTPSDEGDEDVASDSLRHRALRGSLWTLVSVLAGIPLGLLSTTLSARFLGNVGYGEYAVLIYATSLATGLSELGLTTVLQRRVALAFGRGDRQAELMGSQSALGVIAFRLLTLVVVSAFLVHDAVALTLVVAGAVVSTLPASALVLLTGTSRSAVMAQMGLVCSFLGAACLIVTAALTRDAALTFGAYLIGSNLPNVLLLFRTEYPARLLLRPRGLRLARTEWRFGILTYLHTQLSVLVFSRSELLFFPSSRDAERGSYAAAATISARSTIAIDALFGPVPAALATAYGRGHEAYRRSVTTVFRLSAALFALTFPVVVVGGVTIAPYLFPPEFGDLTAPVVILTAVSTLQTAIQPATAAWTAEGKAGTLLVAAVTSGGANLALSALLIPTQGLRGAVAANVTAGLIYVGWIAVASRTQLDASQYRRYLSIILIACVVGAGLAVLSTALPIPRIVAGMILGLLALLVGCLVVRVGRLLGPDEIALLGRTDPRPGRLGRTVEWFFKFLGATRLDPSA